MNEWSAVFVVKFKSLVTIEKITQAFQEHPSDGFQWGIKLNNNRKDGVVRIKGGGVHSPAGQTLISNLDNVRFRV